MVTPERQRTSLPPEARDALRELVRALARQQALEDYRARKAAEEAKACAR